MIVERRNTIKDITPENSIANNHKESTKKALEYVNKAARLKNVKDLDLKEIIKIQKKMIFSRKRIAFNYQYHLICGEK